MNEHIEIGDRLTIEIKRMGINGEGIGYFRKLAIFVEHALPEEEIEVLIEAVYDNRAVAKIDKILKKSPNRMEPFCPVYETCGGCQTQHLAYEETLVQKREILIKAFERYIKHPIPEQIIKKTLGAQNPRYYRNKASLPVQKIQGKTMIGMYARGSNQFVPIDECPVQNKLINQIMKSIVHLLNSYQIDGYDPKTKKGYVRTLIVRTSEKDEQAQVSLIMMKHSARLKQFATNLVKREPKIVSITEVINPDMKKPGFFTNEMQVLYGNTEMKQTLSNYTLMLRPDAFFQLNTEQAHVFYKEMKRLAALKHHETALDAYAGVAPVSHYIHEDANHVYAIEIDKASCESAKNSLEANHISNVTVLQSDFKRSLNGLKHKKIDVMLFDPPRTGLGQETIEAIQGFRPKRLVYGSCNPSTLAKDLNILLEHYKLIETVPIDMFPYTSLVESVSLLKLKSES